MTPQGRLLHLEPFSGIAGDMLLGALLDLGLPRKQLMDGLSGLGVEFQLRVKSVRRGALAAKHVDVMVPAGDRSKKKGTKKKKRAAGHAHGAQHPGPGRSYASIVRILERAKLSGEVRDGALAAFEVLARAEARVHGTDVAKVHFHEVGAVDAIVDITGAAVGIQALGVSRVTCTPVALGHGSVETSHGRLPLPAPATLELLKGVPTTPANVAWETVTPTGAALLRTWVDEFRQLPAMTPVAVGLGAGSDREGPMPNVLRAVLGTDGGPGWDRIVSLETNLDDLVPEHFDHLMERLFGAGALDVSLQNIQMKKNRPGFLVRVLARPSQRRELAEMLFQESSAIGVRTQEWDRLVLPRRTKRVSTPYGRIGVKIVELGNGRVEVSAEYDDCKRAAIRKDAPLRDVVRAAEEAARKSER
ncbi:MAG: nickel pincer cofactor biosynthesis protein LarC [Myxococcota bacterium]|nr:nickel pincer cofactor biosynthesis protein LarC [Myxococcota bacterium]